MATRESDDLPTLDVASRGTKFVDNEGRTLTLRGVNLGGAKLPAGYRSDQSEEAGDDASYIGRPFPLSEAAEHLGRLRAWGFNIVRLSVTWDALEHKGPKQYDTDYVQYVLEVVKACKAFGLYVYVDPHQDVWSRHCGGSGAPAWTQRAGADDPPGRSCRAHSPDEALLPSKPSSETLLEFAGEAA